MRYYLDTEFIEDGKTIDLISIGIVCEDGREYYALNKDCDLTKANDWVKENVISQLPPKTFNGSDWGISPSVKVATRQWKSKENIKLELLKFFGCESVYFPENPTGFNKVYRNFFNSCPEWFQKILDSNWVTRPKTNWIYKYRLKSNTPKPEFWAYYSAYDHVVFCQLFGTMMDLPKGLPMYCNDIKQWCNQLGDPELPPQLNGKHNALEDAKWNQTAWEYLNAYKSGVDTDKISEGEQLK